MCFENGCQSWQGDVPTKCLIDDYDMMNEWYLWNDYDMIELNDWIEWWIYDWMLWWIKETEIEIWKIIER